MKRYLDMDKLTEEGYILQKTTHDYNSSTIITKNPVDMEPDIYVSTKEEFNNNWIPVHSTLPIEEEEVIVSIYDTSGDTPFSYTTTGFCIESYTPIWIVDNARNRYVSHWMPKPKPAMK